MLRSICTLVWLARSPHAIEAATLSVVADKTTYAPGETITLTVNGDAQGASAFGIYGRLLFDGSLLDNVSQTQKQIGSSGWIEGVLGADDSNVSGPATAHAEVFNQVNLSGGFQTATSPIATVILVWTGGGGVVNANWDTTTPGFELDFFGITSSPGVSFSVVPEPGTAALIAHGSFALAAQRRMGRRWR